MIRTAILAGILLVMLSIAYSRPGALPAFGTRVPAVEEQDAMRDEPPAPVVHPAEPSRAAPPAAAKKEEEPKLEEPKFEEPEIAGAVPQAVTPAAPPSAAAEPGGPASLLPQPLAIPVREAARISPLVPDATPAPPAPVTPKVQESAAPAPLPEVYVPTRPVNAPQDLASRLTPGGKIVPAPAAEPPARIIAAAGTKFMTPQERSRELYRLAREMENTFIDQMTH